MKHIKKGESSAFAMNFSLCLVVDMRLTSSHRHLLSLSPKKNSIAKCHRHDETW